MSKVTRVELDAMVDPHIHLREMDKSTMRPLIGNLVEGGADVLGPMPNTTHGLTTAAQVIVYKEFAERLMPFLSAKILPIVLINEETTPEMISECVAQGIFDSKWYPLNRTTKSHNGIRKYWKLLPLIKHCGKVGMKCHFHCEHPSMLFDNRDAEFVFLPIMEMFLSESEAAVIWEHGTDARCIPHWQDMAKSGRFYVTLTPHHLLTDETDSYGDVRKTFKPPAKTYLDKYALAQLIMENYPWVMAGSDYAPHDNAAKHVSKGKCACGAYHGKYVFCWYAHALEKLFETPQGVEVFNNFMSRNARKLHNLSFASRKIIIERKPFVVPVYEKIGPWVVDLYGAGETLNWRIAKQMSVA